MRNVVSNEPIPKEILDTWVDEETLATLQGGSRLTICSENIQSDNDSEGSDSESEDEEPRSSSVEPIPISIRVPGKRRSDTGEEERATQKKKLSADSALPEIFKDSIAQEIMGNGVENGLIDPTAETDDQLETVIRQKTPSPAPAPPTLSPEFKVDSSLEDPYATRVYDF
ncbi:hypothetical protein R3P38DRAFT_3373454 [Favolaschia claudopus]|uniref:Uncharacterized protein n=1 Tax=Favolaschia claudopus TaxID=2862362 RepID=A0AAV9ZSP9_9AGAR